MQGKVEICGVNTSRLPVLKNEEAQEAFGNTNRNGNAIYEVVRQWAELKK